MDARIQTRMKMKDEKAQTKYRNVERAKGKGKTKFFHLMSAG